MKPSRLVPALLLSVALVAGTLAPSLPCAYPVAAGGGAPEGGSVLMCVAAGMLFGASILSGNVLAAAGALVSGLGAGCF